jgi:hypothetical protein
MVPDNEKDELLSLSNGSQNARGSSATCDTLHRVVGVSRRWMSLVVFDLDPLYQTDARLF